ncbi:Pycsar system effector family protein [Salinispora cortesiana]|uniref:Pycsar system effector family protein n=1 Tax=Salinispora cortesiana TaxID=1305843 RepID=UPI0004228980|nr:Pycsar system effector family protein [Salinispora cortesiana]
MTMGQVSEPAQTGVPADPAWFFARAEFTRGELTRVDGKASTLMAIAGAAATLGATALTRADLPAVALAVGVATVFLAGVATAVLAVAVRPCLAGGHALMHYAVSTPHQLLAEAADPARTTAEQEARYLVWLSRLALRKYRRIRLAVDLLLTALAGTAGTAVLAVLTPGG